MYSASDASKRRSLSICILMVLSAFGPISTAVAEHDGGDAWDEGPPYIDLWIELDGSWVELDPYEMTDLDDGTYDMQIEYIDLDVGSNYTLSWSVYGINEDWGELVGNVTSGNVTDTWQMEVSEFDCMFNANVAIINNTDGQWDNVRSNNYDFHGECSEYGTITYSADIGGNWVSEPDEMDTGSYDMKWDVTNLTTGDEYKLDYWYYLSGPRVSFGEDMHGGGHEWVATGTDESIDWNVTISDTDCSLQPESMLWQNTSSGWTIVDQYWVGQLSEVVLLPCEPMLTLSWYDNASGSWEDLDNYAGNSWQDAVIYEGDDSCDEVEGGWECTDDNNNTETWDACNGAEDEYWCWNWNEPLFLEPGDHQFQLTLSYLDTGGSYMLNTHRHVEDYFGGVSYEDEYLEFNAPSDTMTLNETVTIDASTCFGSLEAFLDQNVTDSTGAWGHHPISEGHWEVHGPCEQGPSPFTLYMDGVEWEPEWHYNSYDECEEHEDGYYDCWMDDWDWDGDGEPEHWDSHEDCGEDNANGTWECIVGWTQPHIDEGNHTMVLEIEGLEVGDNYSLEMDTNVCEWMNCDYDWMHFNFTATAETMSETFYLETDNFTCNVNVNARLHEVHDDGGFYHIHGNGYGFNGPCEQPPSPFTLTYDGVEWEEEFHYMEFDECEEDEEGYYDCWMDDWDWDGDGEPDHWEWFEDCEEDANGTWWCQSWWGIDPHLDAGNHTMVLEIAGLEVGDNYSVEIKVDHCQVMGGCDDDSWLLNFTATAETMSETFHVETDNYTCQVAIYAGLNEIHDDGWGSHIYGEGFGFNGPCEQPPSPFTLTYDGVEWEEEFHYMEFDECEEDEEGYYDCWMDDWDWDGDGEPDHWEWFEDCEEDANGTWWCVADVLSPPIEAGNHTMELGIEDLVSGEDYAVEGGYSIWMQDGADGEVIFLEFTATSDTMSETFYMETDNYTCHVSIELGLAHIDENNDRSWVGFGNFHFNGPCEEPPSPFTLTYDGVVWEEEYEHWEYDECEEHEEGYECWHDEWDEDGDGGPDWTDWHEECEEDANGTWWCQSGWGGNPHLDAGNHTMEITIEDVEGWFGPGEYELMINANWCEQMQGCDDVEFSSTFNASSADHTETFHVETDEFTCGLHVNAVLYQVEHDNSSNFTWIHHVDSDNWGFNTPCEQPPSNINLTYELNGSMVDWEEEEHWMEFDDCTDTGGDYECEEAFDHDGDGNADDWRYYWFPHDACEFSVDDAIWYCIQYGMPTVSEGDLDMTFEIAELEANMDYRLEWDVYSSGMVNWDYQNHGENFTAASDEHSVDFTQWVENSTCGLSIMAWLLVAEDWDGDGNTDGWKYIDSNNWGFSGPCEMMSFPVDISLQILDEGTWEDVEGMDLEVLFSEEEEDEDPSIDELMDWIGYYVDDSGNYELNLTLDGLEVGDNYTMWVFTDTPGAGTFVCGNGEEIPFDWVNDGEEDCEDGSDEPQYDENGDPINWFDCDDGSEIPINWVNDGEDDCDDGEDEGWSSQEEEELSFTASSDVMHEEMDIDFEDETCLAMIMVELYHDDGPMMGMYWAMIAGPAASHDDDGNGAPDCLEWLLDDEDGPEGPDEGDWSIEDFAVGQDYFAELAHVDATNGTAMAFIAGAMILDDEFRMKVDYDFFDGDGTLNETEAEMFEMLFVYGSGGGSDECEETEEEVPPFTMNGVAAWCAVGHMWFENLADNSNDDPVVVIQGWDLHYNVSADSAGQLTFYFPGDPNPEGLQFNGTLCGGASPESGFVPVSWSYDNASVNSDCVDVMAGDSMAAIEVVFGPADPDSDGDGYSDTDDRFPNDPNEWADSDDDGVGDNSDAFPNDPSESSDSDNDGWGDNSDEFPNDASEWSDYDGDGVGDNGDAFPWDSNETADSDGDGWGDNADAFPNDASEWSDYDGDGIGDNADTDADGDGTDDDETTDTDGDGVPNDEDDFPFDANETTDTDGDGVGDNTDAFPNDANETTDTDGDGIGDNSDDDADGDGTPNDFDDFPLNSAESTDSDGDGVGDEEDAFPHDANEYADSDGDGIGDNADADDDNDGTPDNQDAFPTDPNETADSDNDGVGDNADAFPNDPSERTDSDNDGVGDNADPFPSNPSEWADSDGDGTGDNSDAFPNDPNEIVDSDGDGVGNNADAFPYDETEDSDTDGDGIGDNTDEDADGDGNPDTPVDVDDGGGGGGILPGFSAALGIVSMLGAAAMMAGRRKD